MGYTTDFSGSVTVTPPLNEYEISFLLDFARSRRMNRTKGPLYAVPGDNFGQGEAPDIISFNTPHPDQPGLWCQWVPTSDGDEIEWDDAEKFYYSAEWMKYLVENLLAPSARSYIDEHVGEDPRLAKFTCDHQVAGTIEALGEDPDDRWAILVIDNVVRVAAATLTYENPVKI